MEYFSLILKHNLMFNRTFACLWGYKSFVLFFFLLLCFGSSLSLSTLEGEDDDEFDDEDDDKLALSESEESDDESDDADELLDESSSLSVSFFSFSALKTKNICRWNIVDEHLGFL